MRIRSIYFEFFFLFFLSIGNTYSKDLGVETHIINYKFPLSKTVNLVESAGINSIRDGLSWDLVEKKKGVYDEEQLNKIKDLSILAKKKNIKIILILSGSNKNYDSGNPPNTDDAQLAFSNYAEFVAKKLNGYVDTYEIWNEWTHNIKTREFDNSLKTYEKLVILASKKIKNINSKNIVIAGSFDPLQEKSKRFFYDESKWVKDFYAAGVINYIDGISLHTYTVYEKNKSIRLPNDYFKKLDKFVSELSIYNKKINFYITEVGLPTSKFKNGFSDEFIRSYYSQFISNSYDRSYIKGVWIYDLVDDGDSNKNVEHNFGVYNDKLEIKRVYRNFFGGKIIAIRDQKNASDKRILAIDMD